MEDKLILAQCHFNCHIGITEEERVKTQPIIIDIELHLNTKTAGRSGELHDSLDYRLAHEAVKTLVEKIIYAHRSNGRGDGRASPQRFQN